MGYLDQAALVKDPDFRAKVTIAIVRTALDVVGEARPGEANGFYAYYNRRHDLGVAVLNDPDAYVDRFAWAAASNTVITPASPDGDIEFMAASTWNDIAGVSADEIPQ